jgi:hypothetical protein
MSILDYPQELCPICHSNTWWYSIIDPEYKGPKGWVCGVCHPPAGDVFIKMRIIKGNFMLNKMRNQISPEELIKGIALLKELWGKLGKTDCLYFEDKKKLKKCVPAFANEKGIECFSCPNDYWWAAELFEVRPRIPAPATEQEPPRLLPPEEYLKQKAKQEEAKTKQMGLGL